MRLHISKHSSTNNSFVLPPSENKTKGLELHRDRSEIKCSENSSSEKSCSQSVAGIIELGIFPRDISKAWNWHLRIHQNYGSRLISDLVLE